MAIKESIEKNYKIIYFIAMAAIALWVAYIKGWILADFKFVSAKDGIELIKSGKYPILDVRDKKQWQKGHIKGAILIPINELKNRVNELKKYKDKEIIIYSKSGREGINAGRFLAKEGFKPINIKSGILGLAIEGGKKYPELFEKGGFNTSKTIK